MARRISPIAFVNLFSEIFGTDTLSNARTEDIKYVATTKDVLIPGPIWSTRKPNKNYDLLSINATETSSFDLKIMVLK